MWNDQNKMEEDVKSRGNFKTTPNKDAWIKPSSNQANQAL